MTTIFTKRETLGLISNIFCRQILRLVKFTSTVYKCLIVMKPKTKGRPSAIIQFHYNNLLLVQHRVEIKEVCEIVFDSA